MCRYLWMYLTVRNRLVNSLLCLFTDEAKFAIYFAVWLISLLVSTAMARMLQSTEVLFLYVGISLTNGCSDFWYEYHGSCYRLYGQWVSIICDSYLSSTLSMPGNMKGNKFMKINLHTHTHTHTHTYVKIYTFLFFFHLQVPDI